MGAANSSQLANEGPVVVQFPDELNENEGEAVSVPQPTAAASTPAGADPGGPGPSSSSSGIAASGDRSLDELPALPAIEGAPNRVILQNLSDYRLEKQVLGEGAFGKVRLATSISSGHQVAVKVIKRKKLNERAEVLLQREVKHHEKVRGGVIAHSCAPPQPFSSADDDTHTHTHTHTRTCTRACADTRTRRDPLLLTRVFLPWTLARSCGTRTSSGCTPSS